MSLFSCHLQRLACLCLFVSLTHCAKSSAPSSPSGASPSGGASNSNTPQTPAPTPVCSTQGTPDATVTIAAKQGPQGQAAPKAIDNRLTSMNVDDAISAQTYAPTPESDFTALLTALKPRYLRWPPGNHGQKLVYSAQGTGDTVLNNAMIDNFMVLARAVGSSVVFGINIETGTPAQAAALVTYLNKTKNYGIEWFQLGNEPDLNGVTASASPAIYAQTFAQFQSAMRAVDPTIKIVGAELMTGMDLFDSPANSGWLTTILANTQSAPMDAIAWHYYPLDSSQTSQISGATLSVAHLLQETAGDWPPAGMDYPQTIFPKIKAVAQTYAPKAQLWVDEYGEDSGKLGGLGVADKNVGAVWAADSLGRFAEAGADAIFRFVFRDEPQNGYALLDNNNIPRPEYYTYWLYAQQFGEQLVSAQSDKPASVAAHAALRASDKSLRILLVNKTTDSRKVRLKVSDYTPVRSQVFQLVGSSQTASDLTINGQSFTGRNVAAGIEGKLTTDACSDNIVTLPATSVTLYSFGPS